MRIAGIGGSALTYRSAVSVVAIAIAVTVAITSVTMAVVVAPVATSVLVSNGGAYCEATKNTKSNCRISTTLSPSISVTDGYANHSAGNQ